MGTTISGSYLSGIALTQSSDNPVLVDSTGTVSAASGFALYGGGGIAWTITNAGLLQSNDPNSALGVLLPGGGTVVNAQRGTIAAYGAFGNGVQLATTVVNDGLITASGYGVFGASAVTNQNQGVIAGGHAGVDLQSGSLDNAGSIAGGGGYGVGILLQSSATVTNQYGGSISGTGIGINMSAGGGTVVNDGLISAGAYGVARASTVTNQSHGTITGSKAGLNLGVGSVVNAGSIGGSGAGSTGVLLQGGGWISNSASGTISGDGIGVNISGGAGTVENAGLISGAVDAVAFGAGFASRLIVDPGARFAGTVDGGGSGVLELAGGGTGTLAGLGSRYLGFSDIGVDAGASWTLTGTNTLAAGVTLDSGGTVTLAAGATLEVAGSVAAGATIALGGSGASLVLDGTAAMAGSVAGFAAGETIELRGVDPASVAYAAGALRYTDAGGNPASFALDAPGGGVQAVPDGAGGADVTALCFCAGTLLATPGGQVPVEQLAVGDSVLTAFGATRRIAWIGVGRVLAARGRRGPATPVIVRKGALAPNVPHRDLHVTKGHALWFDGLLIPVEFLVNHRSILWDDRAQEVALYHVELDRHDVLLANGAPAESYRDDGNRWLFSNANSGWDRPALPPCAPVLTGGPPVDAVWRALLDRAGPRPGLPLTQDADLHLNVDGRRVDAAWRRGDALGFRLARRPGALRIVSRSGAPQELGFARDPRLLGVAIRRILLRSATRLTVIAAPDRRLSRGFHPYEQDNGWRWTDGDAWLGGELFAWFGDALEVELQLGGTTRYHAMSAAA
jgi:hypothetical protein